VKIRTPAGQCIICHDNGEPIVRAVDETTFLAIRRMRRFIDRLHHEQEQSHATHRPEDYQAPA
jgi:hypothetical protein